MAQWPFQEKKLLIIAEAGVAHSGDTKAAFDLCNIAVESGCDAIKFQVYQPRDIWTEEADIKKRENLQLSLADYARVIEYAKSVGLLVGASFFSYYGQALQKSCDFIKIASRSYPDKLPPIVAGVPVIASCGRYLPAEPDDWIYMACVSAYPTERVAFHAMKYLAALRDDGVWGYSSHFVTPYPIDCMVAVREGARVIEKHICIDRKSLTVDKSVSLEPDELKEFVERLHGQLGKP